MKKSRTPSTSTPTKRRRAVQYALVFGACVLVVNSLVGEKGLFAMLRAREQYSGLEASLAQARQKNAVMREEARRLREEPEAIEEAARRDLGLIKDGERIYILRDAPSLSDPQPPTPNP